MAITSFYDPNNSYGNESWMSAFPGWEESIAWHNQVDNDPQGGWTKLLSGYGLSGLDDRSGAARSLYSRMLEGLSAARLKSPDLRTWDYMKTIDPRLMLGAMSPSQKGQNDRAFTGGMNRWGQRPY